MRKILELIETDDGFYTIILDGKFADRLCKDEALGTVAAFIYSDSLPPYFKTYTAWDRMDARWHPERSKPVALLPAPSYIPHRRA